MKIAECYELIIWSLNPGKYDWFQALLIELSNEGYVWPTIEPPAPSNDPLKNIAAIRPGNREVFEKTLRSWKLSALCLYTENKDKNWGRYCQPLKGLHAVIATIEGFLNDPRCKWEN